MTVFMCIQNATWLIYVINYIDNVFLIIQNAGKCTNVNTGLPRLLHIGHFLFQQMAAATLVQNYMPLLWDRPTWYDSVYLACNKKLMGSHLSLQYGINKIIKCKTKNKLASMIGPVRARTKDSMSLYYWCYQNHSDLSTGGDHWTNTTAYLLKTGSYDCMFPPQDEQTMETHPLRTCRD